MTPKAPSAYTVNVAFTSMLGGMDNRMHPSLIKDGSYVRAVNMVVNNGFLSTRSSFAKVAEISLSLTDMYRGSQVRQYGSTSEICLLVGNKFWVVDLFTGDKDDRTGSANLAGTELVTSTQAERYVVIVGQSMGFYWDGSTITMLDGTATGTSEVLRFGTSLHYTCGRLFYIPETIENSNFTVYYDNNKQSLLAGNLFSTGLPANIFKFTEWHDAAGGGAIGMPASLGSMVALASKPDQTGTGTSGLLVFCTNGIISYAVGKPRTNSVDAGNQWYPVAVVVQPLSQASIVGSFGTVVSNGVTALAPLGWTVSNADVLFLAAGGIYSLNSIFRSSSWNSMNVEAMSLALGVWNQLFDAGTSMAANQTRVFATANSSGGIYKAIMTTNTLFTTTDQFGKQSTLWEGAFTGLPTRKIEATVLDGQRKLVLTVERKDTMLEVWTQTEGDLTEAVESRVYFKQIDVNNQTRMNFVELDGELLTDCNFSVYVRPYGCYLWYQLGSTKTLANDTEKHAFSNVRFTLNESPYRTKSGANWNSQTWDVCVLIKGHCVLRRTEVDCSPAPTVYNTGMVESELEGGVDLDATDFDYSSENSVFYTILPVTDFTVEGHYGKVYLWWTNPTPSSINEAFSGVMIRRKIGGYPTDHTDGTLVYSGAQVFTSGSPFVDSGVVDGALYYYSAFSYDAVPTYKFAARMSALTGLPGVSSFIVDNYTTYAVLTWTVPTITYMVGVKILRRTGAAWNTGTNEIEITVAHPFTDRTVTDSSIVVAVGYVYAAYVYDVYGNLSSPIVVSIPTTIVLVPLSASNATATPSESYVSINWSFPVGIPPAGWVGVRIVRDGVAVADHVVGTHYDDTGRTPNRTYNYSLYNQYSNGEDSAVYAVSATTYLLPIENAAWTFDGHYHFSWTAPSAGWTLIRKDGFHMYSGTGNTYTDPSSPVGIWHWYVITHELNGESSMPISFQLHD